MMRTPQISNPHSAQNDSIKGKRYLLIRSTTTKALICHPQTLLNCIDNSGASVVECVNVLKKKRPATIGQFPLTTEP